MVGPTAMAALNEQRLLGTDFAGLRQKLAQVAQTKVLQKGTGGGVERRAAGPVGSARYLDQTSLHESADCVATVHSADRLNLGAGDRLAVGNDGEHLEEAGRESIACSPRATAGKKRGQCRAGPQKITPCNFC